ncbi:unnamed protein product, partial [Sphagnum compactum]
MFNMNAQFPDISGAALGNNNDPILGGTIGLNRILLYLRENATRPNNPQWDLYLVSVYTLALTAFAKGCFIDDVEAIVDRDADLLMTYINAYMQQKRQTPATVIFYAPDYRAIPKEVLRKRAGLREEFDELYAKMFKRFPEQLTELTENPNTRKFLVRAGGGTFPHKTLAESIRVVYGGRRIKGSIGTVMISHCPIDLHLVKTIPAVMLLERYTGRLLTPQEFGHKLVHTVTIPFNTTTHRLFGDDVHLEPLVKGRQKTKLIELATKNQ